LILMLGFSLVCVAALAWALRRFGRQGVVVGTLIGLISIGGAGYLYWNLGAYEMALSTEALNTLPPEERAFVIAQAAQEEFMARNRVADQEIINLFQLVLELDPKQMTALGSMGIIAFEAGEYAMAADYWERMLAQLPPDSDQARAITLGIARAKRLDASVSSGDAVTVQVKLRFGETPEVWSAEHQLFIFARALESNGPPLAAKRLAPSAIPGEIILSSDDAVMGQPLALGQRIEIIARLTTHGPSGGIGDWVATSGAMTMESGAALELVLTPVKL
jgi:cytochrome c-type biogenesis protein CcmH